MSLRATWRMAAPAVNPAAMPNSAPSCNAILEAYHGLARWRSFSEHFGHCPALALNGSVENDPDAGPEENPLRYTEDGLV
jgi:hypothetical protein